MSKPIDKSSRTKIEWHNGRHRFEHWYVDNQVYFITARCRDKFSAFAGREAKQVFWTKFEQYTSEFGFTPWVVSLMDNHYHTLGYLRVGLNLKLMMQRLHGSVAKLVNDLLPERRTEFWRDSKGREYFDGCIRDEKQARLAYRYTLTQCRRHGVCDDPNNYPHTRVNIDVERAVTQATELRAFMEDVPYPRYWRNRSGDSFASR